MPVYNEFGHCSRFGFKRDTEGCGRLDAFLLRELGELPCTISCVGRPPTSVVLVRAAFKVWCYYIPLCSRG